MADIVISVVAKVAEYMVKPVIREGQYFLCVNKIIKDVETEKEQLTSKRDSLQDRVIDEPAEKWLNDVTSLLEEVTDLEQRMRENTKCFPTWRRYCLCKQMVKKIKAMGEFKGNIQPFSYPLQLPGIQYESFENFTYFESTKVVYDQLLEAIQDDCIYMIGVYGMGGSGKTTLVTEVGKHAEGLNRFDMVISITISQTPIIRNIQGKIADMLGLKLEEETEEGRAQRLWLALKDKERMLIIVDDLWGEFNLSNIGICLDNDHKGRWKVIVTTRRLEICDKMDCQKKIHLDLLSTSESWTLFQKHANIDNAFSMSLNDVPRELCKECNGLPIAIVSIASSLKGKSEVEWAVALHSLRHSETMDDHVEEGVRAAMSCLKLSYDYLKNKEAKLLFLMCSMFPEDHHISIEDLIRYAVGLGLGGRFSLESARSRIEAAINKLLDSCLLMHAKEGENHVKMHDIVRDVALSIAKRSVDHKILVNLDKPLTALAEDDSMRDCFAVSSWYVEDQFFIQLDAPILEILLLNTRSTDLLDLSHANFEGIEELKIFHLTNNYYPLSSLSLPQSLLLLTNLNTLRLNKWSLGDISFIACLTRLEVLDLNDCSFNELPNEMGKLKRLKLLDLSSCRILQQNYNGAIGKCSQLEEFYAIEFDTFQYISQIIVDIGTLPELQRFVIYGNSSIFPYYAPLRYRSAKRRRVLELNDINISHLKEPEKNLLQKADTASFRRFHGGCKNFIPDLIGAVGGMDCLTDLRLAKSADIECIFDATSHSEVGALIPRLVELWLSELENMKELCRGPPLPVLHFLETLEILCILDCYQLHNIFPQECKIPNLKILAIENLNPTDCKLEVLFSMSVAQSLQQLEKLTIQGCTELKHIIASERVHGSNTSQEIVPAPRNSHFVMPNLKEVGIHYCRKLECIFSMSVAQSLQQLEKLTIRCCSELKHIIASERVHGSNTSQEIVSAPRNSHVVMPNLKDVDIRDCRKLESIFSICCVEGLPRLQLIQISMVPKLKYVFGECHPEDSSSLQHENLDNLTEICPENYYAKWASLGKITFKGATIVDQIVSITQAENYVPKHEMQEGW